jgi:hypothetical protein
MAFLLQFERVLRNCSNRHFIGFYASSLTQHFPLRNISKKLKYSQKASNKILVRRGVELASPSNKRMQRRPLSSLCMIPRVPFAAPLMRVVRRPEEIAGAVPNDKTS